MQDLRRSRLVTEVQGQARMDGSLRSPGGGRGARGFRPGRFAARARAWRAAVKAKHAGVLVALAAPRRTGWRPVVRLGSPAGEGHAPGTAYGLRTRSVFEPGKSLAGLPAALRVMKVS
jgi:hypothetical protein